MGIKKEITTDLTTKISEILEEVRPLIIGHGGNIELIKYEDGIVYIRLMGACTSCPFSLYTIKLGIEERLKVVIPEIKSVHTVE